MPDGTPIPIVLLANKSDLTDTSVQTDVIGRYCREYAIGAWFITSAKENNNIGNTHTQTTNLKTIFFLNYEFLEFFRSSNGLLSRTSFGAEVG